jgi:hypothetical protein
MQERTLVAHVKEITDLTRDGYRHRRPHLRRTSSLATNHNYYSRLLLGSATDILRS